MEDITPLAFDQRELEGKRVLVTGDTKGGIGEAIVTRLTNAGAAVVTTARTAPEEPS